MSERVRVEIRGHLGTHVGYVLLDKSVVRQTIEAGRSGVETRLFRTRVYTMVPPMAASPEDVVLLVREERIWDIGRYCVKDTGVPRLDRGPRLLQLD